MRAARSPFARLLAVAVMGAAFAGCRLAGSAPTSVISVPPSASASAGEVAADPSPSQAGPEAPAACGFPPGAALEFAGRSTYAELRVGDAKGDSVDPMSDEPADIYITRDTFNQGELHGRLVCAIFIGENEGFVEITIHPEDWGRYTPEPEPGEPANGLTADEAIEAARATLPEGDEWYVQVFFSGPIGESLPDFRDNWGGELTADQWVWGVLARGDTRGMDILIDYVDGSVIGTVEYALDECGRPESDPEFGTEPCPDL
jgi:hypothetical protein